MAQSDGKGGECGELVKNKEKRGKEWRRRGRKELTKLERFWEEGDIWWVCRISVFISFLVFPLFHSLDRGLPLLVNSFISGISTYIILNNWFILNNHFISIITVLQVLKLFFFFYKYILYQICLFKFRMLNVYKKKRTKQQYLWCTKVKTTNS